MNPKTRDLIAQASVSLKRSRRLVRDASRALKEAEAHLAELAKAAPPEPAWLAEAKADALVVQQEILDKYGCPTALGMWGGELRLTLKNRVVWYRNGKDKPAPIDHVFIRHLLHEKQPYCPGCLGVNGCGC